MKVSGELYNIDLGMSYKSLCFIEMIPYHILCRRKNQCSACVHKEIIPNFLLKSSDVSSATSCINKQNTSSLESS